MTARVTIDKRYHRYALDGKRVPNVTTAQNVLAKRALDAWKLRETAAYAASHVDDLTTLGTERWIADVVAAPNRAAGIGRKRGTDLHKLAESLIYGNELPETDDKGEPWAPEVYDMAGQLARWFDAFEVEPVIHEAIVFNEVHGWCGTLDLIADLNTGDRWLLDYKTTASGVWPDNAMQLAAYRHASHVQVGEHVQIMPKVDHAGVVLVRPDEFALVPVVADERVYGWFLHCLALHAWTQIDRDELVLPPVIPGAVEAGS